MDGALRWAQEEVGRADLGHQARTTRAVEMLAQLAAHPAGTVSAAFDSPADRKGAYRFLEHPLIQHHELASALHSACARRCAEHALVIAAVDGSSFVHSDHKHDDGVGPVGARKFGVRGLKSMLLLPMSYDGVVLGVGAHVLWARSEQALAPKHLRALEDRESIYWTQLQRDFERSLRDEQADTQVWYQLDREADASHQLLRALEPGQLFTVRSSHDRLLTAKTERQKQMKLHQALQDAPALGVMYLSVPRRKGQDSRLARLEVRAVHVGIDLRERWSHHRLGQIPITAVSVKEVDTRSETGEQLHWLLLTSYPVHSVDDAVKVVRAYGLRWRVEQVHYTCKSGTCNVEQSQLESVEALKKWVTLQLSVAVHRQNLLQQARSTPELPADQAFSRDEIDAALTLYHSHTKNAPRPGSTPTLKTLVEIIAKLGGYTGKSSGGPPGPKTFNRGMERVETAALALELQREIALLRTPHDGSG